MQPRIGELLILFIKERSINQSNQVFFVWVHRRLEMICTDIYLNRVVQSFIRSNSIRPPQHRCYFAPFKYDNWR